jgi:hypothetical protein
LQFAAPETDRLELPYPCGHRAQYREQRSKSVLTVVGPARISRPYYLCPECHQGQFPVDAELNVIDMQTLPGVRRMLAMVGAEEPFKQGRQQMKTAGRF